MTCLLVLPVVGFADNTVNPTLARQALLKEPNVLSKIRGCEHFIHSRKHLAATLKEKLSHAQLQTDLLTCEYGSIYTQSQCKQQYADLEGCSVVQLIPVSSIDAQISLDNQVKTKHNTGIQNIY